jgi:hypothetical protein
MAVASVDLVFACEMLSHRCLRPLVAQESANCIIPSDVKLFLDGLGDNLLFHCCSVVLVGWCGPLGECCLTLLHEQLPDFFSVFVCSTGKLGDKFRGVCESGHLVMGTIGVCAQPSNLGAVGGRALATPRIRCLVVRSCSNTMMVVAIEDSFLSYYRCLIDYSIEVRWFMVLLFRQLQS